MDVPVSALYLIERWIATKDAPAYRDLARFLGPRFYRSFLGAGLPPFEARDEASTLVTDLVIKFDKYAPRDGASFEAWMNSLVRNKAADWHRRRKGKSFEPVEELAECLPSPVAVEVWVNPELQSAVQSALGRLASPAGPHYY